MYTVCMECTYTLLAINFLKLEQHEGKEIQKKHTYCSQTVCQKNKMSDLDL